MNIAVRDIDTSNWAETFVFVLVGAIFLGAMNIKALNTPFFSENFQYVGQFRAAGQSWVGEIFSPTLFGWFRPTDKLFEFISFRLLALNPFVFHLRNLSFSIFILVILHRLLMVFSISPSVRFLAFFYFVVSKVHLSIIGYLNLFGTLLASLFLLGATLFFIQYYWYENHKAGFWGILFAIFAIFAKESAIIVLPIVSAVLLSTYIDRNLKNRKIFFAIPIVFVFLSVAILFIARIISIGTFFPTGSIYTPQFSIEILKRNIFALIPGLANTAFLEPGSMGVGGIGWLLMQKFPHMGIFKWIDPVFTLFWFMLMGWILWCSRSKWKIFWIPLAWAVSTFAIHLATRNLQLYYLYNIVIAVSMVLGLGLEKSSKLTRWLAGIGIGIIFLNGLISNFNSQYHWQFTAYKAGDAFQAIHLTSEKQKYSRVFFITADQEFWRFALGGDHEAYPMIPELLGQPELDINYFYENPSVSAQCETQLDLLCLDLDQGFQKYPLASVGPIKLNSISPNIVIASNGFNLQPNGQSALALFVENATLNTQVLLDGQKMETVFGGSTYLTILVPDVVLSQPGTYPLFLVDGDQRSNALPFVVTP